MRISDYWRDEPFWTGMPSVHYAWDFSDTITSGLSHGCTSTEADVWLYNDTLYVGHDQSALTEERTLESLYINPILDVLERQNPKSPFVTNPTKK